METEEKVKILEDELKLIKSELRQTLGSVRDFLFDLKLPPAQEDAGLPVNKKKPPLPASLVRAESAPATGSPPPADNVPSPAAQPANSGTNQSQVPVIGPAPFAEIPQYPESPVQKLSLHEREAPLETGSANTGIPSGGLPVENERTPETVTRIKGVNKMKRDEIELSTPQVNLLANLIRWSSVARREIGTGQLPIFLDVYATTGNLSTEMKDIILRLVEVATDPVSETGDADRSHLINEQMAICMDLNSLDVQLLPEIKDKVHRLTQLILQQSYSANKADIWSQLLLELHGILTGGGTSLHPLPLINTVGTKEDKSAEAAGSIEDGPVKEKENRVEMNEDRKEPGAEKERSQNPAEDTRNVSRTSRPARLRLVMPMGDGTEQELELGSLFVETDSQFKPGNGHKLG